MHASICVQLFVHACAQHTGACRLTYVCVDISTYACNLSGHAFTHTHTRVWVCTHACVHGQGAGQLHYAWLGNQPAALAVLREVCFGCGPGVWGGEQED